MARPKIYSRRTYGSSKSKKEQSGAPFTGHAVATVLSSQVTSHDETSILVEAGGFAPMQWFLNDAKSMKSMKSEEDSNEEVNTPKRKKRKVEHQREEPIEIDPTKHIQISHFSIDFHFPRALDAPTPRPEDIAEDADFEGAEVVPVKPFALHNLLEDGEKLQLAHTKTKSPVVAMWTSDLDSRAVDAVSTLATMQKYSGKMAGGKEWQSATLVDCSLRLSRSKKYTVVRLDASIYWKSGLSAFCRWNGSSSQRLDMEYDLLERTFPNRARAENRFQAWKPQLFYDSVHVPPKDVDPGSSYDHVLESQLYPFQERAVSWLLQREGVGYKDGQVHTLPRQERQSISFYESCTDFAGKSCYINHFEGVISRERPRTEGRQLRGGLLAEEMGLGKTVEVLALLSIHRRPDSDPRTVYDAEHDTHLHSSKATLIVTPASILEQWKSELATHAPALRVYHYQGIASKTEKKKDHDKVIADLTTNYDVVLTSYTVLQREVHFAVDPPDRNMRHARKFERKRSVLVQIQWWRVCVDEAQMVESGVSAAAKVARQLPRVNSWAVTGTPLRKDVQDVYGLLVFLRVEPLSESTNLWRHLLKHHLYLFEPIFGTIALRHTKAQIQEDLRLPPQKRVVITMPFSAVEQQQYQSRFAEMCNDVGVTNEGAPKTDDWDPNEPTTIESMRTWLIRLRQTCLHPEVGIRNRKALGRSTGPLRTVAEVLSVMIDQNEVGLRTEERNVLASRLLRAHILGNNGEDDYRSQKALDIYLETIETSSRLVSDAREHLATAKEAEEAAGEVVIDSDDEDPNADTSPLRSKLRNNLRTALQLKHTCLFFAATAYYQIKTNIMLTEPDTEAFEQLEEKETALYEEAKLVRRELLRHSSRKSETLMKKIDDLRKGNRLTAMPKLKDLSSLGGIESRRIVEKSDDLFDVLRELASVAVGWRSKMAEYLLKPLVDDDGSNEITGDEYEDSTKLQDELYVYFDAIKAMQADLNTFVTGQSAPLIDHEVKFAIKECKAAIDPETLEELRPVRHAPELLLELYSVRNKFRQRQNQVGSIRGLIQEFRVLENTLQFHDSGPRAAEGKIVHQHLVTLQSIFDTYSKALAGLEEEIELFRSTQNQRLDFYRQLQELSDDLKPYKEDLDTELDLPALQGAIDKEDKQSEALKQMQTKRRYLYHLRDESGSSSEPKMCGICTSSIENGVLTVCGHQFCKTCINAWWTPHRTCPECRRKLTLADFHNVIYKPQELRAQEETHASQSSAMDTDATSSPSRKSSIYTDVDSEILNQIKAIDLPTSYGTKIDTLGRHLHWIRTHDPGAKSIVFSQYREFLDVLGTALNDFKIGHRRLGRAGSVEMFKHDPSVDCLLLDAKTDSSGLTLVNATHVFICEPLIQTAVELQAIARVHRIGQTRPTTVWMYLISDSVEEAIYEISVARRLAHVQSRQSERAKQSSRSATPTPFQEKALDAANTEEMQAAPLSKLLSSTGNGGELVGADDLWGCLFGKAQKNSSQPSAQAQREVDRHLRAEAAEARQDDVEMREVR